MKRHKRNYCMGAIIGVALACVAMPDAMADEDRIQPYENNPTYWQYKGEPVLLLGGTNQDNLFNHPDLGPDGLEAHLDLLVSVGGNYVRNTMSSRDRVDPVSDFYNNDNPYAFHFDEESGLYDLDRFDDEFWRRFRDFLEMTAERDIIVQIEVWDRWDYAEIWGGGAYEAEGWAAHPFNPKNNVNYTSEETGIPEEVVSGYPIFRTIPELDDVPEVLAYQEAMVEKLLSISLDYNHVLYCISNESTASEEWSRHWARFVRGKADEAGVNVEVTEMWNAHDLTDPMHRRTFDHPDLYSYVDTSQNNLRDGQTHWNNMQAARQMVADPPRPMNNIKVYGGRLIGSGPTEGVRKFWRNVIGGIAGVRFHRPGPSYGDFSLGLNEQAQAHIQNARALMEDMGWLTLEPDIGFVALAEGEPLTVRTERTHVAYTRDADGQARLYVDGEEAAAGGIGGDLSAWDDAMRLALGDELTGGRGWLGVYHGVAVYNQALDASEIAAHHAASASEHLDGLQARYVFDEGDGAVVHDVSGQEPALDLHIEDTGSVSWSDDGLELTDSVLIASDGPAERLTAAMQDTNAITVEAWITPAEEVQSGPARIVTLSEDHLNRNFTLGQEEDAYEMRLRATETSDNALPGLRTGEEGEASIGAARSTEGDRAIIFVTHGAPLNVDMNQLQDGLETQWFDPRTAERQDAAPNEDGYFQPPSSQDWVLVMR